MEDAGGVRRHVASIWDGSFAQKLTFGKIDVWSKFGTTVCRLPGRGFFFSEITCAWNFGTCSGEDMWIYWPRNRILAEYWSPSQLQWKFHKMIDRCITPNASEARKHVYLLRQISKEAIIAGSGEGTMPNPAARSQKDAAFAPSRGAARIQVEHHMDP